MELDIPKDFLTLQEAAEYLRVSRQFMYKMVSEDKIIPCKFNKKLLFYRPYLIKLMTKDLPEVNLESVSDGNELVTIEQ